MDDEPKSSLPNSIVPLIKKAHKLTCENDYDKAIQLYKQAIEYLSNVARYGNKSSKEIAKKAIAKVLQEIKNVCDLKKGPKNLQKEDNDQPKSINTSTGENQETFQSIYYPNKDSFYVELFQELEKTVKEPDTEKRLNDIVELENTVKESLREAVIFPFQYPGLFGKTGLPWPQILLVGPQVKKMEIIRALAHESKANLLALSVLDLFEKWQSDSHKVVKMLFEMGCYYSPAIIYLAKFEELSSHNDNEESAFKQRAMVEFMVQCQQFQSFDVENEKTKVKELKPFVVIGGSECPWEIDRRMLRHTKRICVNLPNENSRYEIFQSCLQEYRGKIAKDVNWKYIIKHTEHYSLDDIATVYKEAIMISKRKGIQKGNYLKKETKEKNESKMEENIVFQSGFVEALRKIKRSASDSELASYKAWVQQYID